MSVNSKTRRPPLPLLLEMASLRGVKSKCAGGQCLADLVATMSEWGQGNYGRTWFVRPLPETVRQA
jgi:hypothetical protein